MSHAYEIQKNVRPEKYVRVCFDSQGVLKVLQASKTKFSLVRQCQKTLNDISTRHPVGLYWVPGHCCGARTSSQETVLFKGLLDLSLPWGSLGRI